jgi:hypothetical protein
MSSHDEAENESCPANAKISEYVDTCNNTTKLHIQMHANHTLNDSDAFT